MNRAEAIARSIARDPIRREAYESSREHAGNGYVLLPDRDLVLTATLVRRCLMVSDLGMRAVEERQDLLGRLIEAMDMFQLNDYQAIEECDRLYSKEYQEATE